MGSDPKEMLQAAHIAVKGSRAEIHAYESLPHISTLNFARCLRWHPEGLNSWSLSDWAVALAGETGELCNVVKKLNRVRDGLPGNKETPEALKAALADEVADVFLYLDLFARAAGFNIEDAIRKKFNETSARVGFPERL
jgi:NTP pyrophosphatase (non-canonical NTP hydrolase)